MHWARLRTEDGTDLVGVIDGDTLAPRTALGADTPAGDPVPLASGTLLPPVVPGKFIGLWNNFHAAAEKNGWAIPEHPLYFLKPLSSLAGPGATVTMPSAARRVIFEGELGVVIGKRVRNATPDQAADAILGYTCVNDFTALDLLDADSSFRHWTRSKGFDGFGVVGPTIATDVNWRDLTIRVQVGARERQSYPASDMIMGPEDLVSRLSADMTLEPGDLIACGTSLGAAPVKAGHEVSVIIDGIGTLSVTMAAEA